MNTSSLAVSATDAPAVLSLAGITKSFKTQGRTTVVLDDIDLDVHAGEFLSIVGPSGSGKTTLLKIIAGLQQPNAGVVRSQGTAIDGPPEGIVYVFQQYSKSVFPWRTVIDNVTFGLEGDRSLTKRQRREIGREQLRLVGLDKVEDHYPSQLSGGMQQRLAIARALAPQPKVLLMDEPFSALDALTRLKLQQLILRLWDQFDVTVVFVTHDIEEALILSTRVVALDQAPATVALDLDVDLPHPRKALDLGENPRYLSLRRQLMESIFQHEAELSPTGGAQ